MSLHRTVLLVVAVLAAVVGPTTAPGTSYPTASAAAVHNGRIAFVRGGDIYTVTASGSGVTRLTTSGGLSSPKYSPDGTRLAWKNSTGGVFVRTLATGRTRQVGTQAYGSLAWSPNGRQVAYLRSPDSAECVVGAPGALVGTRLFSAPADGSAAPSLLYDTSLYLDCDVATDTLQLGGFSPDGGSVTFTSCSHYEGDSGTEDCGMERVQGPSATGGTGYPLLSLDCAFAASYTVPCVHLSAGRYSPSGTRVLFSAKGPGLPSSSGTAAERVYVMSSSGTHVHPVSTASTGYNPTWSPDGTKVLFTRATATGRRTVVVSGTSATARPTVLVRRGSQPDWQPVP